MEYIKKILLFLLFISIVEEMILKQEYRKYVRFFSGLILILIVVNPLISFRTIGDEIEKYCQEEMKEISLDEWNNKMEDAIDEKIGETYQKYLEKEIQKRLEKEGIESVQIELEKTNDKEIERIEICLKDIGKSEEKINKIKKYLNEVYQVDEQHIYITIMR